VGAVVLGKKISSCRVCSGYKNHVYYMLNVLHITNYYIIIRTFFDPLRDGGIRCQISLLKLTDEKHCINSILAAFFISPVE
jgi:hypothetical protein